MVVLGSLTELIGCLGGQRRDSAEGLKGIARASSSQNLTQGLCEATPSLVFREEEGVSSAGLLR